MEAVWLDPILRTRWDAYARAAASRLGTAVFAAHSQAWTIATVSGNETLVQSRPCVKDGSASFLEDLFRPKTRCTLAAYTAVPGSTRPPPIRVPRFQRWVGLSTSDPREDAAELADDLCTELPGFLRRAHEQAGEHSSLFFAFLGQLHANGALGSVFPTALRVRHALGALFEHFRQAGHHTALPNLMVTDGRTFAMLHGNGHVSHEIPPQVERPPQSGAVLMGRHVAAASAIVLTASTTNPMTDGCSISPGIFSVSADKPRDISR